MTINRYGVALESARSRTTFLNLINTNFHDAGLAPDGQILASAFARHVNGPGRNYSPDPAGSNRLRTAISGRYPATTPEQVIVTASASESYEHIFRGICRGAGRVLLPSPGYPLFEDVAVRCGLVPEFYPLAAGNGWQPDAGQVVSMVGSDLSALVLISPNNPTGSMLDEETVRELGFACAATGTTLILDEVFSAFRWSGSPEQVRIGELCPDATTCTINGVSKLLGSPDLKVSWIVVEGPDSQESVERLQVESDLFLNGSPLNQAVASTLLEEQPDLTTGIVAEVAARRAAMLNALGELEPAAAQRIRWANPQGGIHLPLLVEAPGEMDDEDIAVGLLEEESVATHPGYLYGFSENALVLSYLQPVPVIREGARRLGRFLASL
jgi:aspartate/methionine/tyrosine aminotransferase